MYSPSSLCIEHMILDHNNDKSEPFGANPNEPRHNEERTIDFHHMFQGFLVIVLILLVVSENQS